MLDGAAPIDLLTISELITCVHAGVATRSLHHTMGDSGQRRTKISADTHAYATNNSLPLAIPDHFLLC